MSGDAVARLLDGADKLFGFAPDCEITLEANPGTVEEGRFKAFRSAGVNRVSVGVQSFMNEKLARLGAFMPPTTPCVRPRTPGEVFGNFNLDLMFALPGETLEEVAARSGDGGRHGGDAPFLLSADDRGPARRCQAPSEGCRRRSLRRHVRPCDRGRF